MEKNLLKWQIKSIHLIDEKINHFKRLYLLTKHSKKKKRHYKDLLFYKDVRQSMLEEYQ